MEIYKKLYKLFKLNNVSDFRKELLLFRYAKLIFANSMKVFFIILAVIILILVINLINNSYLNFILSLNGIIQSIFIFIFYYFLRKKINEKL